MSSPPLLVSYQSSSDWPASSGSRVRISILDSCFNPPSLAHYAMATHNLHSHPPCDARLLLLSSRNVDKEELQGESSLKQRTAMMELEAKRMVKEEGSAPTAVASLAAATFAEKAPIILDYLRGHSQSAEKSYTLVFYIGFDTVVRLFAKRYYEDSDAEMERILHDFFVTNGCEVVCARRPVEDVAQKDVAGEEEQAFLEKPLVKHYLDANKLHVVEIPGTAGISSTKIRTAFKGAKSDNTGARRKLQALAHDEIVDYCFEKGLYQDAD